MTSTHNDPFGSASPDPASDPEVYAVAAALGQPFCAPAFSSVVVVTVEQREDEDSAEFSDFEEVFFGVYPNRGSADVALTRWIMSQWAATGEYPWNTETNSGSETLWEHDARRWLVAHPPARIVKEFFANPDRLMVRTYRATLVDREPAYDPATENLRPSAASGSSG